MSQWKAVSAAAGRNLNTDHYWRRQIPLRKQSCCSALFAADPPSNLRTQNAYLPRPHYFGRLLNCWIAKLTGNSPDGQFTTAKLPCAYPQRCAMLRCIGLTGARPKLDYPICKIKRTSKKKALATIFFKTNCTFEPTLASKWHKVRANSRRRLLEASVTKLNGVIGLVVCC